MSITTTKGGVLHELTEITANVGGVLYSFDTVTANNGGVLRVVFSKDEEEPVALPANFSFSGSANTLSKSFTSPNCKADITFTVKLNKLSDYDTGNAFVALVPEQTNCCSVSLNSSNSWTQTITETIDIPEGSHGFVIGGGGGGPNGVTTVSGEVTVKFKQA